MRIAVITGTTREGRFSGLVAEWITGHLAEHPEFDLEGIDLRDHLLPFFDGMAPARTGRDYTRDDVAALGQAIDRADGFVVLTGEYNHGYPAVLKNTMDWTFVEWRHKPITFVGWGNVGGARAIEQLRQVAVEFEMAPLRHAVHILPEIMIAVRQAGDDADVSLLASLEPKLDLMIDDLLWWTNALTPARERDPTRNVVRVIDPKREPDDAPRTPHTPDGPQEIEDAAAQELEVPADETGEG